jgi:hypothetical protein
MKPAGRTLQAFFVLGNEARGKNPAGFFILGNEACGRNPAGFCELEDSSRRF